MSTTESEVEKDLTQGVESLSIINDANNTTAETTNSTTTKGTWTKKIRFFCKDKLFVLVDILLNATGNVAIMKKKRWAVDQEKSIGWIMKFVHKYLKLSSEEKLVIHFYWKIGFIDFII